jgi:putative component of toxin-antitoxin plasmid stabilization module
VKELRRTPQFDKWLKGLRDDRVYFCERGGILIIILAGGDKKTQPRDIRIALELARQL